MTATLLLAGAAAALTVGLLLQPVVLRLLTEALVLDTPSDRSAHTVAVPRGGGLAVVAAAAAGLLLHLLLDQPAALLLAPLLLFALIGLMEDLHGVSVAGRLVLQLGAGGAAALLLLPAGLPATAATATMAVLVVATAVWLTGYVNAFNFMDGVNGISVVHTALAGIVYLVVGVQHGVPVLAAAGPVAAAAAVTFLPWNAGRARIFLGDVGSYGLGGLLGALAAYALLAGVPPEAALAPLALYLADTGWTLVRRCYRGEQWHRAHRTHTYQRLADLGWSHQRVTAVTALLSAAVCGCALTAAQSAPLSRLAFGTAAVAILAGYLVSPRLLGHRLPQPATARRRVHV